MAQVGQATTIREIAALAGVSGGTVSRVMNGKPGVGPETRARVLALISEHDFHGDSTARQLSRGRSDSLGIVFPLQVSEVVMHPVYPELLGAISDATQDAGLDVILFTTNESRGIDHVIDSVKRKRVDGLILPAASSDDPLVARVRASGIPTVLVGHRERDERLTWVDCSHDEAIFELTRALLRGGRRSLVLLNGPTRVSAYGLRSSGFWRAIHESGDAGIAASERTIEVGFAQGSRAADDLLDENPGIDAIVCSSDTMAAGVLDVLARRDISVPDDIAVTGFDDIEFSRHSRPTLTTVRMPLHDIGATAVSLLLQIVEQGATAPDPDVLRTELIVRESAGSLSFD